MSSKKMSVAILLIILLFVSACLNPTITEEPSSQNDKTSSYPVDSGYPIDDLGISYPVDSTAPDGYQKGPDFAISLPVAAGDMTVSGTGPSNVPILLLDLSEVDLVLGETTIDETGNFVFELNDPLISQHLIGIKLGDISGTEFSETDFIYNENYSERPYVGIMFDLVVVE